MKILIDADSCPVAVRSLVLRAAERTGIKAIFAANRPIKDIGDTDKEYAEMLLCPAVHGSADDALVSLAGPGDLALTRDIILAERLLKKGAAVLDDRGRIYTTENIRELVSLRNFTVDLAENGYDFERTAVYNKRELKIFAASFDKLLTKLHKTAKQCIF